MGRIKSVRINKKIENMLKHIRKENKKKNETDIFFKGIYMQFEEISKPANLGFRRDFYTSLEEDFPDEKHKGCVSPKARELQKKFDKICDLLEVLCSTDGLLLQEEFQSFIYYIQSNIEKKQGKKIEEEYKENTMEDEEEMADDEEVKTDQYDKIYKIILENHINENDFLLTKKECKEDLNKELNHLYNTYVFYHSF